MATATELFKKGNTILNRGYYGGETLLSNEDLANQGYDRLSSEKVGGGELLSGSVDPKTGQRYESFIQRPAGYNNVPTPEVKTTPTTNQMGSDILGITATGLPIYAGGTTTNPKTISSDNVYQEASGIDSSLNEEKSLYEQERSSLEERANQAMASIEADYQKERELLANQQAEAKKTDQATQFKLGQTGTSYGTSAMRKADLARNAELQGLLDKKRTLMDKVASALKADNIAAAKAYKKEITDLNNTYYERQRQQRKDQIDEYLALSGEDRAERKMEQDERQFLAGEERANRTAALAEEKFNYEITKDMEESALENIKRMASSRIPLDQLSDEQITQLEYNAGLEPGTFEAFYSNILDQTEYGNQMDNLKMEQLKASIARTKQLARGGSGKASTGKTIKVGNIEIPETGDTFTDTVNEMKALRDQNLLTDFGYKERINALMEAGGYTDEERGDLESMVNSSMSGDVAIGEDLEADNNPASDFGIDLSTAFGKGNLSNTPITERAKFLTDVGNSTYAYNQLLREGYSKDAVEEAVNTGFFSETGRKISNAFTNFIK